MPSLGRNKNFQQGALSRINQTSSSSPPSTPFHSLLVYFFLFPFSYSSPLYSILLVSLLESYSAPSSASSGVGTGMKRPGLVPNRPGSYGTSSVSGQRGERQASTMMMLDQVDVGMRQKAGKIISLSLPCVFSLMFSMMFYPPISAVALLCHVVMLPSTSLSTTSSIHSLLLSFLFPHCQYTIPHYIAIHLTVLYRTVLQHTNPHLTTLH